MVGKIKSIKGKGADSSQRSSDAVDWFAWGYVGVLFVGLILALFNVTHVYGLYGVLFISIVYGLAVLGFSEIPKKYAMISLIFVVSLNAVYNVLTLYKLMTTFTALLYLNWMVSAGIIGLVSAFGFLFSKHTHH